MAALHLEVSIMKFLPTFIATAALVAFDASDIHAAEPEDYMVVSYVVNHVTEGKGWRVLFRECLNNDACNSAVDAAGAYVGVPPGTIQLTVETVDAIGLGPKIRNNGEEYFLDIPAPDGYFLCQAHLKIVSAAPQSGSRTPILDITAEYPGMRSYAFVHVQSDPNQRSWVEALYTARYMLYSKRNDPDTAECFYQTKPVRYVCKGATCQANGPMDAISVGGRP
tara:strand:+ start:2072 stop:2740 length:669 start_codon:yes stop_codon:yes gene_type:complete